MGKRLFLGPDLEVLEAVRVYCVRQAEFWSRHFLPLMWPRPKRGSLNLHVPPRQPAEAVQKRDEEKKAKEEQEDKAEGEAARRETKEVQTSEVNGEKDSPPAPRKAKTVPCKVTLLDGTVYSCDLEVSPGAGDGVEGGARP